MSSGPRPIPGPPRSYLQSAWDEYLACLSRILVVSKRDPGVERLVQFVILLAASGGGGNEEEGGGAPGDEHGGE